MWRISDRKDADILDVDGEPMFDPCAAAHGPLKKGECVGLVPADPFYEEGGDRGELGCEFSSIFG
ncbi:hypothetical protein EDE09_12057 [Neorhizobium sp. S3-V5DH]|jgi:hypothetical protein|nr:hypothetical protein EDE09_12057 [Neorhizobium sp. S3-V5DH]